MESSRPLGLDLYRPEPDDNPTLPVAEQFHNTGVFWGRQPYDAGRVVVTVAPEDTGKFKTPTLREIEHTARYMHDGSIATLEEVIDFYDRGGNAKPQPGPGAATPVSHWRGERGAAEPLEEPQ